MEKKFRLKKIFLFLFISLSTLIVSGNALAATPRIAAGYSHTVFIKSEGALLAWGYNLYGQLGDGTTVDKLSPAQIGTDSDWAYVAAGAYFTLAIKSGGSLWAWGRNNYGQLGNGTTVDKYSPVQIGTDSDWAYVAAERYSAVAIKSGGTLWAWGRNNYGQLGDGTTVDKLSPVQIGTDSDWAWVLSEGEHMVALKSNGSLWAWGYNLYGQLGDGTTVDKLSPAQIGTDTDWAWIAPGFGHTLALKSNGSLWAWGNNGYGQLGNSTMASSYSPVQTGTDTDWVKISSGSSHAVALKSDGTIWGWGYNRNGQLGDGTTVNRTLPVKIGSDIDWTLVGAGRFHTIALKSDGTLWAWGANGNGQLGDATTVQRRFPVLTIGNKLPPITTASPAGGTYTSIQTVSLKSNKTAIIYYTTDGTTPTTASSVYKEPIRLAKTTTLKFFAVSSDGNTEEIKTEDYTLNIAFEIKSLSPSSGKPNMEITVSGIGFGEEGKGSLIFDDGVNKKTALYNEWLDTEIKAIVPWGLKAGKISVYVTNEIGETPVNYFTLQKPLPAIKSLDPTSGKVGLQVTISGNFFGDYDEKTSKVYFGKFKADIVDWKNEEITMVVPDMIVGVKGLNIQIKVKTIYGISNKKIFKLMP